MLFSVYLLAYYQIILNFGHFKKKINFNGNLTKFMYIIRTHFLLKMTRICTVFYQILHYRKKYPQIKLILASGSLHSHTRCYQPTKKHEWKKWKKIAMSTEMC